MNMSDTAGFSSFDSPPLFARLRLTKGDTYSLLSDPHRSEGISNLTQGTWLCESLFDDDLHAKRILSLANATLGVIKCASLAVNTIGQGLALARGLLTKHAIKQVDRLLSNEGIDVDAALSRWIPYVVGSRTSSMWPWIGPISMPMARPPLCSRC